METLSEILLKANNITVLNNGTEFKVDLNEFKNQLVLLTDKSYFSPALGVSIHEHTVKEMSNGYWVKFIYNNVVSFAQMPFNELLIEIKPDFYGFNIIRKFDNKYTGRCFYLNLNRPSTKFFEYLVKSYKNI